MDSRMKTAEKIIRPNRLNPQAKGQIIIQGDKNGKEIIRKSENNSPETI